MSKVMLIVDDSRLSRTITKTFVKEKHPEWTLLEAEDGQKALELVKDQKIDLATIDMNMPGMDGITVGTKLRAQFPHARLSMLTANVQSAIRNRADEAGLEFIEKPITKDKILAFISEQEMA